MFVRPTRQAFQLVAMASLYLAIKLHSPRKVSIRAIVSTGNGTVSVGRIEAMELSIMRHMWEEAQTLQQPALAGAFLVEEHAGGGPPFLQNYRN